jgi:hypothetical protein
MFLDFLQTFCIQRSAADADPFSMGDFDDDLAEAPDLSINHYPTPYCNIVESLPTACFHVSLIFICYFFVETT